MIARAFRCSPAKVRRHIARSGGVRPHPRSRNALRLSASEREEISRGIASGESSRSIGRRLNRPASTISREVKRNGGRAQYRAAVADERAWDQAKRPRLTKLDQYEELRELVRFKLSEDWSPQQISAWLQGTFADEKERQISHEAIYRALYTTTRLALPSTLLKHLRSGRSVRHPRAASKLRQGRGRLIDMQSIHDRPTYIQERVEVGHWEGDLVMGRRPSAVATLVERSTRMVRLVKLSGIKGPDVRSAIVRNLAQVPPHLRRSLTWDRGREMSEHGLISQQLAMDVYFCDPGSPWQRGSNENTNRLLRQYLPKKTDVSQLSQLELDRIAERLNSRPRRVLGWNTSEDLYALATGEVLD